MKAWRSIAVCVGLAGCVRTTPQPPPPPPPPAVVVPEGCTSSLAGPWVHGSDPSFRYEAEDDGGTLTLRVFHELVVDAGFTPRRFRPVPDAGSALDGGPRADAGTAADAGLRGDAGSAADGGTRGDAGASSDGGDASAPADAGTLDAGVRSVDEPDAGPAILSTVRVELVRTANGFTGFTLAALQHPSGRMCEGRFPTRVLSCADGGLLLETQGATALGDACQAPARPFEQPLQQHPLVRPPDAG